MCHQSSDRVYNFGFLHLTACSSHKNTSYLGRDVQNNNNQQASNWKREKKRKKSRRKETRMTASVLKQDPNT